MRVAVVVAPQPGPLAAEKAPSSDRARLRAALEAADFRVVDVPASADVVAEFERALAGLHEKDVVVVVILGGTVAAGGSLVLRVGGGAQAVDLSAFGGAVAIREPADALFFVEARHDGAADDAMTAAEHVDAVARSLDARARGFAVLAGARADEAAATAPDAWPFARLLVRALNDPESKDDDGSATIGRVYARMRAMPELTTFMQSFALVRGKRDFEVVRAPVSIPPDPPSSDGRSSLAPASLSERPHLMPLLLGADEAREREDWDAALDAYKKALMIVAADDGRARATIYCDVGDVKRAQGKAREAELNYEKALAGLPTHRRSIEGLIELAIEAKDPAREVANRAKLIGVLTDDGACVKELVRIATTLAEDLHDPRHAIEALERARALRPESLDVLGRLRALYESTHRWAEAIATIGAMCDATPAKVDRAALRFAQGDIALARLRDEAGGLAWLEATLEDDPRHEAALRAVAAVRTARREFAELDALYARLVDRFAKLGDKDRAHDVCKRLGALRRDKLRDGPGSIEAFTGAVALKPNDADSRAMLADLYLARGDEAEAVAEFEAIAQVLPARASTYQRLFALHSKAGRRDRAWLAAQALEELHAADVAQQILLDQYRPEGAVRPSRFLDDAAWDTHLRAPGADHVVTGILGAIVPAAVKARVAELREARMLSTLDPKRKQDAAGTASVVRTFAWASQVLGVTAPDIYLLDDVPGGIAAAQVEVPSTAVGKELTSGVSAQDLAFLAGRHLAYYRPEHYALVFYPSLAEVSALFLSAVKLALPEVPVPVHLGAAVARMRKALAAHVTRQEEAWLKTAVRELEERGGRVDLAAWIRSVELTACRAGLLLCGDLRVAGRRVRAESRAIAEVTADERHGDLLSFCASSELAALREILGVTARPSVPPPRRSSRPPPPPTT